MKSMLIIDGSRTLAKLFAELFEKRGWTVVICSDREGAIRRLDGKQLYHAIVLSDRVAGTNGVQLVRMIRALEHRRMTAVVMVTGCGEVMDEALKAGADEVLVKPINPNALVGSGQARQPVVVVSGAKKIVKHCALGGLGFAS